MTLTRANVFKSSIAFSLRRVKVQLGRRFYDLDLTRGLVEETANKPSCAGLRVSNARDR